MADLKRMLRRYMLQHAHPGKFIAEVLGIMWGVYFVWNHKWVWALIVGMGFFLLSTIFLWGDRFEYLGNTHLGRVMLVYINPLNFVLYNASIVPLVYGLWSHNSFFILLGVTIILLPHLWAWRGGGVK